MTNSLFNNQAVLSLLTKYQSAWALMHLMTLATWDSEVYMPEAGVQYRGMALAKTQTVIQQFLTDKEFRKLLDNAASADDLNDYERAVVRVLNRELKYYLKLPADFIEEFEQTISKSQLVWRQARLSNDYASFEPYLAKIVELSRQKADYLGYSKHIYDALLDIFEEGSTVAELDDYFKDLIVFVDELLAYIQASKNYDSEYELSKLTYKQSDAVALNSKILEFFRHDPAKLRLDISSHPFSESLSTDDARITTRYEGKDIMRTVTSTIHEFGHALYSMQVNPELNTTPLYTNYSLGIHESQSRFFENHIGRSRQFLTENLTLFHELGAGYKNFDPEEYYRYFNKVKPGLIRVEADEVTYHAHIYIRYQIEKDLMTGELETKDLPEKWNQLYQAHLGITPKTYKNGCLQDIHWSMGAIGYFPTYSIGTVLAARWAKTLETELAPLSSLLKTAPGIQKTKAWLGENIHTYGAGYTLNQLALKVSGAEFSTDSWEIYLKNKYHQLY